MFHGSVSATQHEDDVDECNNYDISDLCSDDSTDDELDPRKNLPAWANGNDFVNFILLFHYIFKPFDCLQCLKVHEITSDHHLIRPAASASEVTSCDHMVL